MTKNILIIEDEFFISEVIKDMVTRFGHNVVGIVRSGEKVMESIEKANPKPDLIISDIYLAGVLTGVDCAKLIEQKYDIPIIFITAYSDKATKEKMDEVNYVAYLYKPFQESELEKIIEDALVSKVPNPQVKK